VADALKAAGHNIRIDTDALIVGSAWRDTLMRALMESDALVAILTPRALESHFVIAEIGAARALSQSEQRMAIFPLLVGETDIPPFIQALWVFGQRGTDAERVALASGDVDGAVQAHLFQRDSRQGNSPRLFTSHRHKDEPVVRALVGVLQAAFEIGKADIRC